MRRSKESQQRARFYEISKKILRLFSMVVLLILFVVNYLVMLMSLGLIVYSMFTQQIPLGILSAITLFVCGSINEKIDIS